MKVITQADLPAGDGQRILLSLSGGLDSASLLYLLLEKGYRVTGLNVNYGQRHSREIEYARKLARKTGIELVEIEAEGFGRVAARSAVTGAGDIPEGHYADESMKQTVVPMRNAMFLNLATAYAISHGYDGIAIANHAGDHPIYPDCRPAFLHAFAVMAEISWDGPTPNLLAPFAHIDKGELAKLGIMAGLDPCDTWSCYKGGEVHCGLCGTCVERKEALAYAMSGEDPTEYTA